MTDTQDLIAQLRLGASISRDRNLNLDFAKVADEAADKLQAAQAEIERLKEEDHTSQLHLDRACRAKDAALARLAESQAEIERLTAENHELGDKAYQATHRADALQITNDTLKHMKAAALARLAEIEAQNLMARKIILEHGSGVVGASPVQPSIAASVRSDIDIHLSHCFQPPYNTSCKYGDDDCPATPKEVQPSQVVELQKQEPMGSAYKIIEVLNDDHGKTFEVHFEGKRIGASCWKDTAERIIDTAMAAGTSLVDVKALQDQVVDLTDSRDFYKRRVDLLQQWQSKMRDPERTICCDIIANGQTLPPENAGNRYAVQPSQAEKLLGAAVRSLSEILECPYDLDEATISSCGLEETMRLSPYQVVGNMSVALGRVRNAKAIIAAINAKGAK